MTKSILSREISWLECWTLWEVGEPSMPGALCMYRILRSYRRLVTVWTVQSPLHFDSLVQERRNSSVLAMVSRLSCTNPSIMSLLLVNFIHRVYSSEFGNIGLGHPDAGLKRIARLLIAVEMKKDKRVWKNLGWQRKAQFVFVVCTISAIQGNDEL